MLRRKEGATIAQIVAATGWQPHTVRGAFAGALKKKLGLTVTSEKVEGGERVYRIATQPTVEARALSPADRPDPRHCAIIGLRAMPDPAGACPTDCDRA